MKDGRFTPPGHRRGGVRPKEFVITLGKRYWYLPTQKEAMKNEVVAGVVLSFGGSDGGPHGDRWSTYITWPPTGWAETRQCVI